MTLNELCIISHERAKAAGWWDQGTEKTPLECHMLIVSEIAEASEAVRDRKPAFWLNGKDEHTDIEHECASATAAGIEKGCADLPRSKPEGEATELADAVIRIADWFGRHGWDLEAVINAKLAYNQTRAYRHGDKAL